MTRLLPLLAAACSSSLLSAGCGEKEEPAAGAQGGRAEPFRLMLDYFPNADHAGIYAARSRASTSAPGSTWRSSRRRTPRRR